MESLFTWAWSFLVAYILAMIAVGILAGRRVHDGDDYAVARRAYGPVTLALAFAATTASGATFLGMPGLTYSNGFSALWYPFCYPLGVYIGVILCMNTVAVTNLVVGRFLNISAIITSQSSFAWHFQFSHCCCCSTWRDSLSQDW